MTVVEETPSLAVEAATTTTVKLVQRCGDRGFDRPHRTWGRISLAKRTMIRFCMRELMITPEQELGEISSSPRRWQR